MPDRPKAPSGEWLSRQLRRGHLHAERIQPHLEASIQQVLDEIAHEVAAAFTARTHELALTAAAPGVTSLSTMVALKPTAAQAAAVAVPDGEPPENLHVTLCYLGETVGPLTRIAEALVPVAYRHAALAGTVGGVGAFGAAPGDPYPVVALPDVPGLVELRVAVTDALVAAGIDYARSHGFCAHLTLAYQDAPAFPTAAVGLPLTFGELLVVRGDTEIVPLPLAGTPPLTAAVDVETFEGSTFPRGAALTVTAALPWSQPGSDPVADMREWFRNGRARGPVSSPLVLPAWMREPNYRDAAERALQQWGPPGVTLGHDGADWPTFFDRLREVAEQHRPAGGYGDTWWNGGTKTVWWVAGDWTTEEERDAAVAAFTALPEVEAVEVGWEELPTSWMQVYGARPDDGFAQRNLEGWRKLTAAAGDPPPWHLPATDEIIDVDAVVARIKERIDPVRQAAIAAAMTPVLEGIGIAFDTTNPLVHGLLAQSGSQVTDIADTTRLNVMRAVRASWEEGLSIPHTAEVILAGMTDASPARARLIARTELVGAVNGGSLAAVQIVENETDATYAKVWMTAPGAQFPRHDEYDGLDGQTVGLSEPFDVGGYELQHPGDPDGPPEEICNCFPAGTLVAGCADVRTGMRRRYRGNLVTVETAVGHRLAGTPNHPVLTDAGWKPLGELREGDYLISAAVREDVAVAAPQVDDAPAAIEEVVAALARRGMTRRVAGRAVQFHGDPSVDGEVDVVRPYRQLRHREAPAGGQHGRERVLMGAGLRETLLSREGSRFGLAFADATLAPGGVRGLHEAPPFGRRRPAHPEANGVPASSGLNAGREEVPADDVSADPVEFGERLFGDAFKEVARAQVVSVQVDAFHGEVFNLETGSGAFIANGIIAHNCRCTMRYDDGG